MASTEFATRSHKGAGFLFFLGFVLVAAGAGFAFAPHYSWHVVQIARQASAMGLQSGALVVGGLVCFGLGIVARGAGAATPAPDTRAENEALQSELHLLNEQLSTKLAQLRTSLMQIGESVAAVAAHQQAMAESQGGGHGGPQDQSQDAVFRLAASLDKLHAHFDERVHAVDLQLRSGFESLLNASQDVRRFLSQGAAASPAPGVAPHGHAAPLRGAPGHPGEGGIAFYETMQKLDAISGEESDLGGAQEQQPGAPFPSQGQDLDALLPEEYRNRY